MIIKCIFYITNISNSKNKIIISIIILFILFLLISFVTNPLVRSEETIKNKLLLKTPIGSTEAEVLNVIKQNEDWRFRVGGFNGATYTRDDVNPNVRVRTLTAHLGSYTGIFFMRVDVEGFWRFNDDGLLFEISVRKWLNTL